MEKGSPLTLHLRGGWSSGVIAGGTRTVRDGIVCLGASGGAFNGGERHIAPIPTLSVSQHPSPSLAFRSTCPTTLHFAAPIPTSCISQHPSQHFAVCSTHPSFSPCPGAADFLVFGIEGITLIHRKGLIWVNSGAVRSSSGN